MAPVLQWQRPRNLQASQALSHAPTEKMEKAIMAVYAVWDLQACMRLHEYEIVWVITPEIPEAHEAQFNLSYLSWWFMWLGAFGCISLGSLECLYPSMFIQYDRDISRWSTKSCQLLWLIVVFGQNGSLLSLECGKVKVEPLEVGWYPSACQMMRLKQNILNISKISEISENSKDHINTNNSKASTCQISQNITNHIQHITTCLQLNHLHHADWWKWCSLWGPFHSWSFRHCKSMGRTKHLPVGIVRYVKYIWQDLEWFGHWCKICKIMQMMQHNTKKSHLSARLNMQRKSLETMERHLYSGL